MKTNIFFVVLLLFLLAGCANSSQITHSWRSGTASAKSYNKIMVLCLLQSNNREVREKMETHMVGDLTSRGYVAVSSLKEYGPEAFENMTEDQAIAKLRNSSVNALITIVLLDKKKETYYIPNKQENPPHIIESGNFWGYYSGISSRIFSPGYYQVDRKYFWESNFYDMDTKQLIYSAQTKSFNPDSKESLAHEYGKMIVRDMAKQGILK